MDKNKNKNNYNYDEDKDTLNKKYDVKKTRTLREIKPSDNGQIIYNQGSINKENKESLLEKLTKDYTNKLNEDNKDIEENIYEKNIKDNDLTDKNLSKKSEVSPLGLGTGYKVSNLPTDKKESKATFVKNPSKKNMDDINSNKENTIDNTKENRFKSSNSNNKKLSNDDNKRDENFRYANEGEDSCSFDE